MLRIGWRPRSLVPCLRALLYNAFELMKCLCSFHKDTSSFIFTRYHVGFSSTNMLLCPSWQLGPDGVCFFLAGTCSRTLWREWVSLSHSQIPDVSLISSLSPTSRFSEPNRSLMQCHVQMGCASLNTTGLVTLRRWQTSSTYEIKKRAQRMQLVHLLFRGSVRISLSAGEGAFSPQILFWWLSSKLFYFKGNISNINPFCFYI